MWLKQSTAITLSIGPFLDKTDGVTPETGLSALTVRVEKNGTWAARNDATATAHQENGMQSCVVDATDTGTLGRFRVMVEGAATHLPVWHDYMVVAANVWDSFFGVDKLDVNTVEIIGTAPSLTDDDLDVNVANIANSAITAVSIATGAITAAKFAANAIDAAALATDAVNEIADQVWNEQISDHDAAGTTGALLGGLVLQETTIAVYTSQTSFTLTTGSAQDDAYNGCNIAIKDASTNAQKAVGRILDYAGASKTITLENDPLAGFTFANGDSISILTRNAPTKAEIQTEADASLATYDGPTDAEMIARTLLAASYFDPATDAVADVTLVATTTINTDMVAEAPTTSQVNAEVDTALADINLDHLMKVAVTEADVVDNTALAKLVSKETTADWDDFVNTTDSLQAIRDRGDAEWATGAGGTDQFLMQTTTITGLTSQTSFNLTAGSADAGAYKGCIAVITDVSTATQKAIGVISAYSGSPNLTITLLNDPGIFTMANTDNISILADRSVKPAADNETITLASGQVDLLAATQTSIDNIETDTADIQPKIGTPATDVSADIAAVKAETALIIADTNELQTDDVPGLIAALNDPTVAAIADGVWDEILTGATHNIVTSAGRRLRQLQESGAVYGGQVWIDTLGGTAGTVDFENGTSDNHVLSIADAKTIASSVGLVDFHIINGSSITLLEATQHESYFGDNWNLALGGQNIEGSHIEGATITGLSTSTTDEVSFDGCEFGDATIGRGHFDFCGFFGTLILGQAADYNFHNCYGKGVTAPVFNKTTNEVIVMETVNFVGGITISNIQVGDSYNLDGTFRTITLNGVSGTVHIHGQYEIIIDNRSGSPTLDIAGAIKSGDVADILVDTSDMQPKLGTPSTDVSADIAAVKVETVLILADTADIQPKIGAPAADLAADIAAVKAETVLIVADTGELQSDDVPGLIAALNDISAAEVNAEMVDVESVDIITQPGQETPAANQTRDKMRAFLYKAWRNKKTQSASEYDLFNDDTTTVDQKATLSEAAGVVTVGEVATGP